MIKAATTVTVFLDKGTVNFLRTEDSIRTPGHSVLNSALNTAL